MKKTVIFLSCAYLCLTGCAYRHYEHYDRSALNPKRSDVALLVGVNGITLPNWKTKSNVGRIAGGFSHIDNKSFIKLLDSIELIPGKHRFSYEISNMWERGGSGLETEADGIDIDVKANSVYALEYQVVSYDKWKGKGSGQFQVICLPVKYSDLEKIEGASISQVGWRVKASRP